MDDAPFDCEPAHEPAPDEPKTPPWLTVVGVLAFLALGGYWLARTAERPAAPVSPAASASAPVRP